MNNLTIVVPFFNGHEYMTDLLAGIPSDIPVLFVDDQSEVPLVAPKVMNVNVVRPEKKLYFTGAVNYALERTYTDILVLNQDVRLVGTEWLDLLENLRSTYAYIGERIRGSHPAFPNGYIHGVFQFMRRDAINAVGLMDEANYPLWGASALWQWQICRKGFRALPLETVPGLSHWHHDPKGQRFGPSIQTLLKQEPSNTQKLIRTPPAISVIVPSYNYGRYLTDCISSLIGGDSSLGSVPGQTFQSFEIIIINDGSSKEDPTDLIGRRLADGWNGIKYIYQQNTGLPRALNRAIGESIGKYITILSADDMREPWSLQDLYDTAVRNPHRVIYDDLRIFANGSRLGLWPLAEYDFENLLEKNLMHAGILYEREAWKMVGGYPVEFRDGREDWSFNVALGEQGYCGLKIERSGYLYRREGHNRSLGNSTADRREAFKVAMVNRFPHLYRGERSMACCGGGSKRSTVTVASASRSARVTPMPNAEDMILMEYIGGSVGSRTWGGPGATPSGRYYRFGANPKDRVKYVEASDEAWLAGLRIEAKSIFRRFTPPKEAPPPPTEITQSVDPIIMLGEVDSEDEEDDEAAEPVVQEILKPVGDLKIAVTRVINSPDPSTLTVGEIQTLNLKTAEWQVLLSKERAGKNRVTVIRFAQEMIGGNS